MRELDFEISNNGFNNARKHARTHGAGAEVPKAELPHHHKKARVAPEIVRQIIAICEEFSRPSANRTIKVAIEETPQAARHRRSIKNKKTKLAIPVRVWQVSSVRHAYTVYCQRHPDSKSIFSFWLWFKSLLCLIWHLLSSFCRVCLVICLLQTNSTPLQATTRAIGPMLSMLLWIRAL